MARPRKDTDARKMREDQFNRDIRKLQESFQVEREFREMSPRERKKARKKQSRKRMKKSFVRPEELDLPKPRSRK